jgi:hypothetical protein
MKLNSDVGRRGKMSYFMIAIGRQPDCSSSRPIEALPIQEAQEYVQNLIPIIVPQGLKVPIWFIHDGETGTSHNFITMFVNQLQSDDTSPSSTSLINVIKSCEKAGNSFRIWWAGREQDVVKCTSIEDVMKTIIMQAKSFRDISIEYKNSH